MESDHDPSTFRASVVPNNPYFENNVSLQMWEIYMDFGGIWKLIFIKFWWSGDAGTLTARDPVDPRVLFHPLVVHCTTNLPPRSWRLSRIVDRRPVPSWFLDIQGEHSAIQKLRFKDNWYWIGKHHCFDLSLSSLLISGIRYKYQVYVIWYSLHCSRDLTRDIRAGTSLLFFSKSSL